MRAKLQQIHIPKGRRTLCISDIHGNLDGFCRLLRLVNYTESDVLVLPGDLYLKGPQPLDTLRYIMALCERPNVYALRGNCDWGGDDFLTDTDRAWLSALPHIIESEEYIFVHCALSSNDLHNQDADACMKTESYFPDCGIYFHKYVIAGHMPTPNFRHHIPRYDPYIDHEHRIVCIDGGNVVRRNDGQLNALIIEGGQFSHMSVDDLPVTVVTRSQREQGDTLNITWLDRFIEIVQQGEHFHLCRHLASGKLIPLPKERLWTDADGRLCCAAQATDYHLPVEAGETVRVVARYGDKIFAKKGDVGGWIDA